MSAEDLHGDGVTWLNANWMFLGPCILFPLLFLNIFMRRSSPASIHFMVWSLPAVYSLHQFEEHGYDIFGERYAFLNFLNSTLAAVNAPLHLTVREATLVNVVIVWIGFPIAGFYLNFTGEEMYPAFMWGLAFFNGLVAHVIAGTLELKYNPGFAQSLCLMVPLGFFFMKKICEKYGRVAAVATLVYGGPIGHGVFLILPCYLYAQGYLNDLGLSIFMLFGMVLPLPLARRFGKKGDEPIDASAGEYVSVNP